MTGSLTSTEKIKRIKFHTKINSQKHDLNNEIHYNTRYIIRARFWHPPCVTSRRRVLYSDAPVSCPLLAWCTPFDEPWRYWCEPDDRLRFRGPLLLSSSCECVWWAALCMCGEAPLWGEPCPWCLARSRSRISEDGTYPPCSSLCFW